MNHIIRTRGPVAISLLLLLITGLSSPAQNRRRLPDSIPGSVENTPTVDTTATVTDTTSLVTDTTSLTTPDTYSDSVTIRAPVTFRAVPDSVMARLKKDRDFAYANDPAYWTPEKENEKDHRFLRFLERLLSSKGFKYFIYLFLAALLFYALYKIIAENNLRLFYREGARLSKGQQPVLSPEDEDFDGELARAMAAQDHRQAVRYLYLKALRLLDAKKLIQYHPEATNLEYINQMNLLPQGEAFRVLTKAYERVWYGEFPIDGQQFERALHYFQEFYNSI